VKLGRRAAQWDREVSILRGRLQWREMISRLIDPEVAWRVYTQYGVPKTNACTMCGGYCPMMWVREQVKKVVV